MYAILIKLPNKKIINVWRYFFLFCLLVSEVCHAIPFEKGASFNACFTPGMDCTQEAINAIDMAHKNIYVQAYSFTSYPIEKALVDAKDRGVNVKILLDKSQYRDNSFSSSKYFSAHDIPVWIDSHVAIAHNKVMVIDNDEVVTGSFNFTNAAEKHNAENLLIIKSPELAQDYLAHWWQRYQQSTSLNLYAATKSSPRETNLYGSVVKFGKRIYL